MSAQAHVYRFTSKAQSTQTGATTSTEARASHLLRVIETAAPDILEYLVRRINNRDDAADLLNDTLLIVWRRAPSLPAENIEARMWVFGIARNVLATYRRGDYRRQALADRLRTAIVTSDGAAGLNGKERSPDYDLHEHVRTLIRDLDDIDREIISLVHWEGFTLEQTARILSMRAGTVRSRYARARAQLRQSLVESGDVLAGSGS